jgi:hypothetical protein
VIAASGASSVSAKTVRVLLAISPMGILGGCLGPVLGPAVYVVTAVVAEGIDSANQQPRYVTQGTYGDPLLQSLPRLSPQIGTLRLVAYPLNASARQARRPFVICIVPTIPDGSPVDLQMRMATLDPTRILLTLDNATSVKPSGYALPARCPYPEERPDVRDTELVFREIDFTQPLVWRRDTTESVSELALRFDLVTPSPNQTFSLDLGLLSLNEEQHVLPKIEFSRTSASGAISLRPSSQGVARPIKEEEIGEADKQNFPSGDFVNCLSKGERVWAYRSQCDK